MDGGCRAVFPEPGALALRHRIAAEGSFAGETGLFEFLLPFREDLNCVPAVHCFLCEVDHVTKLVLGVLQFGAISQPCPVEIGVRTEYPGQSFDKACVQIRLHDGAENHFSRIAQRVGAKMLEARVAECGKLLLEAVLLNLRDI